MSSAYPYWPSLVGGTGGFRLAGSAGQAQPIEVLVRSGQHAQRAARVEQAGQRRGDAAERQPRRGAWTASAATRAPRRRVTGAGLLPPSMYTRPDRSLAPDLPWKSQVA